MKNLLHHPALKSMGIRSKLIGLFVAIKVIPLILLALMAWNGLTSLGADVSVQTDDLTKVVRETVEGISGQFTKEAEKALDRRAQEELERITTDTARAVADFLYERDGDIQQAARLEPNEATYRIFVAGRTRKTIPVGQWQLAPDGKSWEPKNAAPLESSSIAFENPENQQDFHYRVPETVIKSEPKPLFHEITYVGLDGQEKIKVSTTGVLPSDLRNISRKENTWAKAETYFSQLQKLKPGEIYVSEVVGPYVGSRVIGPVTPSKAESLGIPFEPEKEAFAGRENPLGKKFQGIVRWATPVVRDGKVTGYVTLALDHNHIMAFTNHLLPSNDRYTKVADASQGNYAFIWDHKDRNIAHPRHHSIVGFDPKTGEYATPWLENSLYEAWQQSGKPLKSFLATQPIFDGQTREKKPAKPLIKAGQIGLDCRYLNFAPQCQGWHELTEKGGSGSFLILWTGVWKLTTAAAIPYQTGQYAHSPRGFGYVTIGANIDEYHKPAQETAKTMAAKVAEFGETMKAQQATFHQLIASGLASTAASLTLSTALMIGLMVVVAIWLASTFTRHIKEISSGLRRIEQGDFSFRFVKRSEDEVGQLTDSLNTMADGVQESFRRLEQAKHEAEQASHMKTDFLARVSHELRTPLNGILGFAELIKEGDTSVEESQEHAEIILSSGEKLLYMVNDILDLSKMESGNMIVEPENIDLPELLRETMSRQSQLIQEKGLTSELSLSPDSLKILRADPKRLSQLVDKLFENAVKFTPQGTVAIRANYEAQQLMIDVIDTGPGIPIEQRENLFAAFRQGTHFNDREHGGAGIGLALVKENLRLLGGDIQLLDQEEPGCCFRVTLPVDEIQTPS